MNKARRKAPPGPLYQALLNQLTEVDEGARAYGTNLTALCEKLGIGRATPSRWRRQVPMTIRLIDDLLSEVAKLKAAAVRKAGRQAG